MQNGTCLISGKCYVAGECRGRSDPCWKCLPEHSTTDWTSGKSSFFCTFSSTLYLK